jgi:hypothetical protein
MTVPESQLLQLIFSLILVVPSSYVVGRVHQWYSHSLKRDGAFRRGYDHASHSMFDLALRRRGAPSPVAGAIAAATGAEPRERRTGSAARIRRAFVHPAVTPLVDAPRQRSAVAAVLRTRAALRPKFGRRARRHRGDLLP